MYRPSFLSPGEKDLGLLVTQEKGQMGLDERQAELWNPQAWAQSTGREGKQEGPHRHTHRLARQVESALRSKAAKHTFTRVISTD